MSSVAVPPKDGSPVALVVVSEDVATLRPCQSDPAALDSTHLPDLAALEAVSAADLVVEVVVSVVVVVVVVVVASAVVVTVSAALVVVLDIKVDATASVEVGKHPLTLLLAPVVDAVEASEEASVVVTVVVVVVVVADSTVVLLEATQSPSDPEETAMVIATAVTTVTTVTEIAAMIVWAIEMETEVETEVVIVTGTVIVSAAAVTGMEAAVAAGKTMAASDTVRMMQDTMTLAPGEDTRTSLFSWILTLFSSVLIDWWVSLISPVLQLFSRKGKGMYQDIGPSHIGFTS
jgi:hypothetical protein